MNESLQAVHLLGIHTDSLGHYLCSLGLLSAASRKWPSVRGCWRGGHFVVLSTDTSLETLKRFLSTEWQPTKYERWWYGAQKNDTKANRSKPGTARSSANLWKVRNEMPAHQVHILDAHLVGTRGSVFNRLWGTGGNVGKRNLDKLYQDATKLLRKTDSLGWLDATLTGESTVAMPDLKSAGTWFVFANKTYNSGQDWFREGRISPWSVLLAMEGAFLLSGGVGRRLGVRSRPYAVFPFISEPSQPTSDSEIGLAKAEFWAPLWEHPASLVEVRALFQRGLARLGGRPAQAPPEFAIAARAAGVDAGVREFARYELRQTTSSQVYEAIPRGRIVVGIRDHTAWDVTVPPTDSDLLMELIDSGWFDRLPYEPRDSKQRGKFVGLRGPIEAAIVAIGEAPTDAERWQRLLMLLARAQARIDRNKNLRDRCIALPWLSPAWFDRAWPEPVPPEISVARGIASVGARTTQPLLVNVFGVELAKPRRPFFPASQPQRAVWNTSDPLQVFPDVVHRRLIDARPTDPIPLSGAQPCSADLVNRLIFGDPAVDLEQVACWVPPLSLIDWSGVVGQASGARMDVSVADGTTLLHGLMRPLFQSHLLFLDGKPLFTQERQPHSGLARQLLHLLRYQAVDEAVQVASNWYLAAGHGIVVPSSNLTVAGDRIAAALLVPQHPKDIIQGFRRWLHPRKARAQ